MVNLAIKLHPNYGSNTGRLGVARQRHDSFSMMVSEQIKKDRATCHADVPHLILLQDRQLYCLGKKVISYCDGLFPRLLHSECTSNLINHGAFIVTDANTLIDFYSNRRIITFNVSERSPSMGIVDLHTHFRRVVHKDLPLGGVPTIDATVSLTFCLSRNEAGLPMRKVYKTSQRIN